MRPKKTDTANVIRDAGDIPEWFDIQKYRPLRDLDLAGWERQFRIRSYVHYLLVRDIPDLRQSVPGLEEETEIWRQIAEERRKTALRYVQHLTVDPIITDEKTPYEPGPAEEMDADFPRPPKSPYSVRPMAAYEAFDFGSEYYEQLPEWKEFQEAAEAYNQGYGTKEQLGLLFKPLDLFYQEMGLRPGDQTYVVVDLSASDEQIVADFSTWLTKHREMVGISAPPKKFTCKDFETWVDDRIIPYIDLYLWQLTENCTITQSAIARAIFPNVVYVDTTERVRRTTRTKAMNMLQENVIRAMAMQLKSSVPAGQ